MLKVIFSFLFIVSVSAVIIYYLSVRYFNKIGKAVNKRIKFVKNELDKGENDE